VHARGRHAAALEPRAFATLLLLAVMFGSNHVAARVALDQGLDVATAVAVRSLATAGVVAALVHLARIPWTLNARQRRVLPVIGLLLTVQSACLYSAVARIPVGLALLAFNTFPLWTALWARVFYRHRAERRVLLAMPLLVTGLALALDISGAASGMGAKAQWAFVGTGLMLALAAAAAFGLTLVLTQHEVAALDGRLRTAITLAIVGVLALAAALALGGPHWPHSPRGWWGLAALTVLYGTAFTIVFTLLPKLGVVGSSPILNVEPVAALLMAWAVLGQAIAAVQWLGALIVVGTVMALGLRPVRRA
jgi:drug/metabolite transporter (DMT)-like permease